MFTIGQRVKRRAFTDCFEIPHPEITNLTVIEEHTETGGGLPDYQRLTAVRGFAACEGAARFFELEEENGLT